MLALAVSALAFAPATSPALRPTVRAAQPLTRTRADEPVMAAGLIASGALRWACAGPALYALMSVNEYCTHRWYQHAEFNKEPIMQAVAKFIAGCVLCFLRGRE